MKIIHSRTAILALMLLAAMAPGGGLCMANSPQSQSQNAQDAGSKKASSAQKKSNSRELSADEGGARGFELPGDGAKSKSTGKTHAKQAKAAEKPKSKTAPKN
jgi:hypothetical protein